MPSSQTTPSSFPHPARITVVLGGAALLLFLGLSYLSVLRATIHDRQQLEDRFRSGTAHGAETLAQALACTVSGVATSAGTPAVISYLRQPSPTTLVAARNALSPLLNGPSDENAIPFAQVLLLPAAADEPACVGDDSLPAGRPDFTAWGDPAGGARVGLAQWPGHEPRLGVLVDVADEAGAAGEVIALFGGGLADLLQVVRPCLQTPSLLALATKDQTMLGQSANGYGRAFAALLGDRQRFNADLQVTLGSGAKRRLVGCWEPVGELPLHLVRVALRREVLGTSSPTLVVMGAVASGCLVLALLALFLVVASQRDQVVRGQVELAEMARQLDEKRRDLLEAEEEARRVTHAFGCLGHAVIVTDRWGIIEYANPAFEKLLGFQAADVKGRQLRDFAPPDEVQRLSALIARSSEGTWSRRIRCRHRDGERLRVDVNVAPIHDLDGSEVTNYIVLARDVRSELEQEERAMQARKLEAIGRLAGALAHSFNNVLQVILGYTGEMAETAEDPELADGFHQVLAACRTGSDLTARLVAFSRQQATHRELGSVNAAIRSCAPTIQRWLGSNVDLQLAMAGDPWNVLLDASRIEQALVQLAENARDAMPYGGTVTIRTANVTLPEAVQTVVAVLPPGDYVRIDVIDTGKGIAPEDLHRIFEPLYTTRQQTGLKGLGLCVVHGTIAQHAGGIVVKSVPAQGTTFEIYLPRSVDQPPQAVAAGSAAEPAVASSGEGRCILLAEDEEAVRDVAVRLLEKAAYNVIEAVDGHEAIAKFDEAKDRIDLALLDIVMPEASGAAVAAHIRATSPGTPILFCSGFAKHQLPEGIALPEDIPLIGKPYEPHQLLDAIARLIEPR